MDDSSLKSIVQTLSVYVLSSVILREFILKFERPEKVRIVSVALHVYALRKKDNKTQSNHPPYMPLHSQINQIA
jgi:hypothetical protein